MTSIGFSVCESLESITIPDSVTNIGKSAFSGCGILETVQYTGSEEQWERIVIGTDNTELLAAVIQYKDHTTPDPGKQPADSEPSGGAAAPTDPPQNSEDQSTDSSGGATIPTDPPQNSGNQSPGSSSQAPAPAALAAERLIASNVLLSKTSLTYTGKAQKPAIRVKNKNGKTVGKASYKAVFRNNRNVGMASVTLTFSGSYTGTVKKTFKILPKGTAISKVTAKKKGLAIRWKKQKIQTNGYEIQYSTSPNNFKSKKASTSIKVKTTAKTIILHGQK